MKYKILAAVVTYNRKALLSECLNALMAQTYQTFDILVVDNASEDGTGDMVEAMHSDRILYCNTGKNHGAATGFAFAVNKAIVSGYDLCWTMDDDTIPNPTALESDLQKIGVLKGRFSFLSSMVEWTDGSHCVFNTPAFAKNIWVENKAMETGLIPLQSASYTSCLFHIPIVKKAGLPIREYFIYADDVEFTSRLCRFAPGYLNLQSVVVHKMSSLGNANVWLCEKDRIDRWKYAYRNLLCTAKRNGWHAIAAYCKNVLKTLAKITIRSKDYRMKRMATVLKGTMHGVMFHPPIRTEYSDNFFKSKQ